MCYIGTNNYKAGYEAGKKMAVLMNNSGEVAILQGGLDSPNLNMRVKGFKEALLDTSDNIKLVAIEETHSDYALAVAKTEELLVTYPNLKAIFGVSAYEAPAAALVIKDKNRKDIVIGGFDDLKDTLKAIREGYIRFSIIQSTYKMGWLSVEMLFDLVSGKKIPSNIDTGITIVDRSNVDTYFDEIKKEFKK